MRDVGFAQLLTRRRITIGKLPCHGELRVPFGPAHGPATDGWERRPPTRRVLFGRLRRAGSEIGAPVHGESWICGVIYRAGLLGTMAPYILNMKFARSHSLLQLCLLAIYNLLSQAHAPAALVVQIGQNFTAST